MDDKLVAREMDSAPQSFQCRRGGADGAGRERDAVGSEVNGIQGRPWVIRKKIKDVSKSDGRTPILR